MFVKRFSDKKCSLLMRGYLQVGVKNEFFMKIVSGIHTHSADSRRNIPHCRVGCMFAIGIAVKCQDFSLYPFTVDLYSRAISCLLPQCEKCQYKEIGTKSRIVELSYHTRHDLERIERMTTIENGAKFNCKTRSP